MLQSPTYSYRGRQMSLNIFIYAFNHYHHHQQQQHHHRRQLPLCRVVQVGQSVQMVQRVLDDLSRLCLPSQYNIANKDDDKDENNAD